MAGTIHAGSLERFAADNRLAAGSEGDLPGDGALVGIGSLQLQGAAHGALPGGGTGVLVHCTYETRSDDHTTTHHVTAVVMRVPQAMGYAPYLLMGASVGSGLRPGAKQFEPAPDVRVLADEGIDEGWLTELFSPAFSEWLQRSPDDFGAEYASGVLTVARASTLTDPSDLTNLCKDAAKIASVLAEEALEASEAGGGKAATGKAPGQTEVIAAGIAAELQPASPPAHVESELAAARSLAQGSAAVFGRWFSLTILWIIGINVIGGGIYGLLLTVGDPLTNVLIWQAILLVVVGFLVYRSVTGKVAKAASEQAFYAGYLKSHGLREVDPLKFAAEHADADLPGNPKRVWEGMIGGAPGALMLTGDGRKRGDQIALVRGPRGPVATAELNVSAPGISAAALDEATATLLLDLETAPAPVPPAPAG